jgi:TrpR-related protein YerC/YecD
MKKQKWVNPKTDKLFKVILKLERLDEARRFFRDLLTEQEIEEFASRWEVARMLAKKTPYSKIEKETGMSSTTIARISKWLNEGMGGYKLLIKKFGNQVNHHSPA